MAWARPSDAPKYPSCPLEALEPRENDYKSLTELYGLQFIGGATGAGAPILLNYFMKRPLYAGIWKPIVFGIGLAYAGKFITEIRQEMADERDAVLRHYITLHPEDFPPYKKRLIKDIIEPWVPVR